MVSMDDPSACSARSEPWGVGRGRTTLNARYGELARARAHLKNGGVVGALENGQQAMGVVVFHAKDAKGRLVDIVRQLR